MTKFPFYSDNLIDELWGNEIKNFLELSEKNIMS